MTLKDIAQMLDLPESTLRKYRDAYTQFIPYVGSGRERRYREDSVEVFRMIRDCRVEKHLSWEDTEKELIGRFPVNADAVGKKVVVSEDEGNIFLEKLEKAVRQLTTQGERQEFVTSTLAGELLKMKKDMEKLLGMEGDIQTLKKSTYSYNEVVQRQHKEGLKETGKLFEALAGLTSAVYMIPSEVAKSAGAAVRRETPAPAATPDPLTAERDAAIISKLREQLKDKEGEAEKFRDLYIKAKREVDRLREEMKKKALEEMYGAKKPSEKETAEAQKQDETPARGGSFLSRVTKKKKTD